MNRYSFNEQKHYHALDGKPLVGTSSVVGVLAKNLTWWSAELSAVECLEAGEHIPSIREEYLVAASQTDKKKAIDALQKKYPIFKKARFAHFTDKNKKAEKGIDLHAELERFIGWKMGGNCKDIERQEFDKKIFPFIEWSDNNVKKFLWSEAHCYSEKLWVGGICDAGALLNDDTIALIDFKSAKSAYISHYLQCAGYALEIEENGLFDKDGNSTFPVLGYKPITIQKLIVVPFGAEVVEPKESNIGIGDLKRGFESCVALYKILSRED